jgi:phosphohistidine phosphatase SixA
VTARPFWRLWWPLCVHWGRCTATTILVRHAEVATSGGADPPLSSAGLTRAQELQRVLSGAGVGAIFVSQYRRTRETADSLASALGISPSVVVDADQALTAIRALSPAAIALVVGHTNTVPDIVSGLGGPAIAAIDPSEFDNLFMLSAQHVSHLRYGA